MKFLDKDSIGKAIESITKRGRILDADIHVAACSAVKLREETGDTMWVNRLYTSLPKGTRAAALSSWFLKYGGVIANDGTTGKPKGEQPFLHTKDKAVDLQAGIADPWFDHSPDKKPDEVVDMLAVVMSAIKKAKGKQLVHADLLVGLQALVDGANAKATADTQSEEPEGEQSLNPTHNPDGTPAIDLAKGLIAGQPATAEV